MGGQWRAGQCCNGAALLTKHVVPFKAASGPCAWRCSMQFVRGTLSTHRHEAVAEHSLSAGAHIDRGVPHGSVCREDDVGDLSGAASTCRVMQAAACSGNISRRAAAPSWWATTQQCTGQQSTSSSNGGSSTSAYTQTCRQRTTAQHLQRGHEVHKPPHRLHQCASRPQRAGVRVGEVRPARGGREWAAGRWVLASMAPSQLPPCSGLRWQ